MTPSGKSLFFFGIYVFATGLLFLTIPEKFVAVTGLPAIPSGWGRVIGLLALVIGSYDMFSGRANIKPVIQFSVPVRIGFAVGAVMLYLSGQMPAPVILFGGIDALGAVWTSIALKSEKTNN